jgi:RNA polymerase sigma factor (sigma-70 family)
MEPQNRGIASGADGASLEECLPKVYEELRAIARGYFRNQPASFTLRPTDIVDEACLHLLRHPQTAGWQSPEHFRAIATRKIWQVIVDHLKQRNALKRGGRGIPARETRAAPGRDGTDKAERPTPAPAPRRRRVPVEGVAVEWQDRVVDLLDLAEALEDLADQSRRLRDVVMLHWFGGLKYADAARELGISPSTAEKDFRYALAWLGRRLSAGAADGH